MAYVYLAIAIVAEVVGTVSLKLSDGFTKTVPSILVIVGYITAFRMLSAVLKLGMPVGVAYAIWSAAGVAAVATVGALFLKEGFGWVQAAGLVLIIGGVVTLELGRAH